VCNAKILNELHSRHVDFTLPEAANFEDQIEPYQLDGTTFEPGTQVPLHTVPRSFLGYGRPGHRGVGTRNDVVIMGTSSRTASYARALAARLQGATAAYDHMDDIVAVAHTEGGGTVPPNNLTYVLRTLSGFLVHPNVGAVLAVDDGREAVTNARLKQYADDHGYPLSHVPHHFLTLNDGFQADLDRGAAIIEAWLPEVNQSQRQPHSLAHLNVALQCGGSDAFSGISGNPLAAWVAKEIVRYGGTAHLAETDELIGAESYMLQNVKDLDTARKFLATIEAFKTRVAWHGHSAEGNPSGGNMFRGLYNIVLKSLGAAMKRHPAVRLDGVIDYGERLQQPGYYFMNSPGNDLESIAGQVAAGANMIFFITGNGAITNFPFVPTIKVVTTTGRFEQLAHDMDVNAGAYQDGTPLPELGQRMLDLTVEAASGSRTKGELAGHAQVSLWRDWQQTDARQLARLQQAPLPSGAALPIRANGPTAPMTFSGIRTDRGHATDQIGLLLPTSLCSGQIARLIADRLDAKLAGPNAVLSRIVALPHTEGCGVSSGISEAMYARTMLGYLTHPLVKFGLLLEHGCEKTHNDYMANQLERMGCDPQHFGWASVQLDGGIDAVTEKVDAWFANALADTAPPIYEPCGLHTLRLALLTTGPVSPDIAEALAHLTHAIVGSGGTLVLPETSSLLTSPDFCDRVLTTPSVTSSLAYGQVADTPGLHVMETPTEHWVETLTGLGATGVELMLAYVTGHPRQAHPLVPLLQVTSASTDAPSVDVDLVLTAPAATWADALLHLLLDTASRSYAPKLYAQGNTDFQVSRGLLGISL
jgi:altronate dehydratase